MGYFLYRLTLFGPLYPFAFAKRLYPKIVMIQTIRKSMAIFVFFRFNKVMYKFVFHVPAVYLGHSSEPVFEVV